MEPLTVSEVEIQAVLDGQPVTLKMTVDGLRLSTYIQEIVPRDSITSITSESTRP